MVCYKIRARTAISTLKNSNANTAIITLLIYAIATKPVILYSFSFYCSFVLFMIIDTKYPIIPYVMNKTC